MGAIDHAARRESDIAVAATSHPRDADRAVPSRTRAPLAHAWTDLPSNEPFVSDTGREVLRVLNEKGARFVHEIAAALDAA
jgi:hypothetical protein